MATRQRARIAARIPVRYRDAAGESREGVARDLHEDGLFLAMPDPSALTIGSVVDLELSDWPRTPVTCLAEVVHRREGGCGMRFVDLSPATLARLTALASSRRQGEYAALLQRTQADLRKTT
jgi:hypothetical protein